jgi:shikimate kinase
MTIILQGMCYSGKSTLGKMVAAKLDIPFLDSKDLFIKIHGISEIDFLSLYGRDAFIEAEKESIRGSFGEIVLSLGGSATYYPEEMKMLKENNRIVWLNVPFKIIEERKEAENKERPVVYPDGITTFQELYEQRAKLYPKYAHYTIDVESTESPEKTRDKIISSII